MTLNRQVAEIGSLSERSESALASRCAALVSPLLAFVFLTVLPAPGADAQVVTRDQAPLGATMPLWREYADQEVGVVIYSSALAREGVPQIAVEGMIEYYVADDLAHRRSRKIPVLRDLSTGTSYPLSFASTQPAPRFRGGERVSVRGWLTGGDLHVKSVSASTPISSAAPAALGRTASASAGAMKSLVLRVSLIDAPVLCTASQAAIAVYTGPSSANALWNEVSFGLVSFPSDTNQDGQPDVYGPFTINARSTDGCDYFTWADLADAAATSAGINLSMYGYKIYVIPQIIGCTPGLGQLGRVGDVTSTSCYLGRPCRMWFTNCNDRYTIAHELGHNLGMMHASADFNNDGHIDSIDGYSQEYSGGPSIMGSEWAHVDAAHKVEMGWIPPSKIVDVGTSGTFTLAPIEADPAATPLPQVLRMFGFYHFSYRVRAGIDSTISGGTDQTNVTRHSSLVDSSAAPPLDLRGSRGPTNTLSVTTLLDGGMFQDPVNGLSVTQLSHSDGQATVHVEIVPRGGLFHPVSPCRWLDTRSTFGGGDHALHNGVETVFKIAGRCGIPTSATTLSANVTITAPTGEGHLRFYSANLDGVSASVISFAVGQTRANNAMLSLSADGYQAMSILPVLAGDGSVQVILDVNGYFE